MLGWLTAQYRFDRYRDLNGSAGPRILLVEDVKRIDETVRLAEATALVRDLVNTPTADMGPPDLQTAAERMAKEFGAKVAVVHGDELQDGYPMVHAVGRAADKAFAPRLHEKIGRAPWRGSVCQYGR